MHGRAYCIGIRKSPRRLERYPTYVLDVTSTSNQATTPGRGATAHHSPLTRSASSGYSIAGRPAGQLPIELDQDELERFEKFLGAVIDEFLLRHGFTAKTYLLPDQTDPIDRAVSAPVQRGSAMLAPPVTPVRAASSLAKFDCRVTSPRAQLHLRNVSVHSSSVPSDPATPRTAESYPEGLDGSIGSRKRQRTDNSHASRVGTESRSALQPPAKRSDLSSAEAPGTPPPRSEHEAGAAEELDMSFSVDASGRKRYKWIEDIVGVSRNSQKSRSAESRYRSKSLLTRTSTLVCSPSPPGPLCNWRAHPTKTTGTARSMTANPARKLK